MAGCDNTKEEVARLDERITALSRSLDRSEDSSKAALKIASDELARRLHDLNGEASRLRNMQASYLPRETWQVQTDRFDERIKALENVASNLMGRMVVVYVVWGLFVMFLSGVISYIVRSLT